MSMTSAVVYVFPAGGTKLKVPVGFELPTMGRPVWSDSQSRTSAQRLSRNSNLKRFGSAFFAGGSFLSGCAGAAATAISATKVARMSFIGVSEMGEKLADYRE